MVRGGIETEDRELEAVLSLSFAVTPGRIATISAKDRNNIVFKVKCPECSCFLDRHRHAHARTADIDLDARRAIGNSANHARRADDSDLAIETAIAGVVGPIDRQSLLALRVD